MNRWPPGHSLLPVTQSPSPGSTPLSAKQFCTTKVHYSSLPAQAPARRGSSRIAWRTSWASASEAQAWISSWITRAADPETWNGIDAIPAFAPFQTLLSDANERSQDLAKRSQKVAEELADLARANIEAMVEAFNLLNRVNFIEDTNQSSFASRLSR